MTVNELIEALGRAPAGTDVLVLWSGHTFNVGRIDLLYDGGWVVQLEPDLNTVVSVPRGSE